ncbi:16S rRNA (guanine(966)-N(2))-methyltransferase RsmD [soil metagenome]
MRIISGIFRGKKLNAPVNLPVRPTTDYAKTGLFNILANNFDFTKISAVDLYAGTGSISYELFSRGCTRIIAVDIHAGCIQFIRQTLLLLKAPSSVSTVKSDVQAFLERVTTPVDLILADPPFENTPAEELVESIFSRDLIRKNGLFVLEHHSKNSYDSINGFKEKRKYGNVTFSFFSPEARNKKVPQE